MTSDGSVIGPSGAASTPAIGVVTCAVLEMEIEHLRRDLKQVVHVEVLEQGLHNEPDKLRLKLQEAINHLEDREQISAIVLGYGLCSRGTEGVRTRRCKLVIPRAHDCITLLLGDRHRYADYVQVNPGTYWYSPGWNKHHIPPGELRHQKLYEEYLRRFGKDEADYLMETEQAWFAAYNRATYVDLGIGVTEEDVNFSRGCARWLGWSFDHQHGDPDLLRSMLAGNWDDERFLVLVPRQTFRMTIDERVIEPVPLDAPASPQQAGSGAPAPSSAASNPEPPTISGDSSR